MTRVYTPVTGSTMDAQATAQRTGQHRSAAPDLLFEDQSAARVDEIRPYLEVPERLQAHTPLHRLTLFATYRCQLRCPYCRTPAWTADDLRRFPQKRHSYDLAAFKALMSSLGGTPVRHLHVTGGEATLVPDLPAMVEHSRTIGIPHVSLTSNGTLPWPRIEPLVASGLTELRISIDAHEPALGGHFTGRSDAWSLAVANLARLVRLRETQPSFFLIANTVITAANRHAIAAIVRFLIELGVDDIKLIASVDDTPTLGRFAEAAALLGEARDLLAPYSDDAFPLLRRKLDTVFDEDAVGLKQVTSDRRDDWRCYIPLTEITADRVFYYPCSVYLREGGAPLGRIEEPMAQRRAKAVRFVRDGRCLSDPICTRYCLRCTGQFNSAANDARQPEAASEGRIT